MLNPWYVTGFCDGEAAFTYSRAGGIFNMYFAIRQREDNRRILEEMQEFFDYAGYIYKDEGSLPTRNSGWTKPSAYYRISRVRDLIRVIAHFDKYPLQSKKNECYKIWKEMVLYKKDNWRSTNFDKLRILAEQLANSNQKSRAFKVHKK